VSFMVTLEHEDENKLFLSPNAPLSSTYTKTQVAWSFGLISRPVRDRIDTLRSIRNAFAHSSKSISFDTPIIAKDCKKLPKTDFNAPWIGAVSEYRRRYVAEVLALLLELINASHVEDEE